MSTPENDRHCCAEYRVDYCEAQCGMYVWPPVSNPISKTCFGCTCQYCDGIPDCCADYGRHYCDEHCERNTFRCRENCLVPDGAQTAGPNPTMCLANPDAVPECQQETTEEEIEKAKSPLYGYKTDYGRSVFDGAKRREAALEKYRAVRASC